VKGGGPKGRVLKEDVQGFVKRALAEGGRARRLPARCSCPSRRGRLTRFGEVSEQPLSRIKKLTGAHLHRCWLTVPHVTQFDEADITELEAFRRARNEDAGRQGTRLTLMPFLMKAVVAALQAMPQLNSALSSDGERLITRRYYNVGVAVDTPNGLVVPVIREVERKGVLALAQELGEISARARDGKLLPADLQGGCFSISASAASVASSSRRSSTPRGRILGVSRASTKPVWDGAAFQPRLMLPLALSYDHRVIDGADGCASPPCWPAVSATCAGCCYDRGALWCAAQ